MISSLPVRIDSRRPFDEEEAESDDPRPSKPPSSRLRPSQSDLSSDELDPLICNDQFARIPLDVSDDDDEPDWTPIVQETDRKPTPKLPQLGETSDSDPEPIISDGSDDPRFQSDFGSFLRQFSRGKVNWEWTTPEVPLISIEKITREIIRENKTGRLLERDRSQTQETNCV